MASLNQVNLVKTVKNLDSDVKVLKWPRHSPEAIQKEQQWLRFPGKLVKATFSVTAAVVQTLQTF